MINSLPLVINSARFSARTISGVDQLAFEVVAIHPVAFAPKPGVNIISVSGRRRRGVTAFAVAVVVDRALVSGLFPQNLSRVAVDADDFESVVAVRAHTVVVNEDLTFDLVLDGLCARDDIALDVCGEKNPVSPEDRLRMAMTSDRSLPFDVFVGAPFCRNVGLGRNPRPIRAAPLRPVVSAGRGGA